MPQPLSADHADTSPNSRTLQQSRVERATPRRDLHDRGGSVIIVALVVCVFIVVWVVIGWGAEARRAEEARAGPRYAQPYNIRRAFRNAVIIVAIVGAVVAFSTL